MSRPRTGRVRVHPASPAAHHGPFHRNNIRSLQFCFAKRDLGSAGPAATYSPAPWDAVPSALRRLTAEFEMGSGSGRLAPATGPAKLKRQARSGASIPAQAGTPGRIGKHGLAEAIHGHGSQERSSQSSD